LRLARGWGLRVEERPITINEVLEKVKNKALKECFGTGTAAVISPVGDLYYKGENYSINGGKTGDLAQRLFDEITGLQYGERKDAYGWMDII
jgi:branched-chain amino acid aminotransferase